MAAALPHKLFCGILLLAFVVVVAGAFVRLSDAGLGCPDWPGCYGQLVGVANEQTAQALYPDSDYDRKKAFIEVGHRYIAGLLGVLLLVAAVLDWRQRRRFGLPQTLVLVVAGQALLGMLTVTEKLKPIIVVSHLSGGMLILALLAAIVARKPLSVSLSPTVRARLSRFWFIAAVVLVGQILLGGWVSANYAGIACPDFPLCHGGVVPSQLDFTGYLPARDLHETAAGGSVTAAMLQTIHWGHRLGAIITLFFIGFFIHQLRRAGGRREATGLLFFLISQIVLGILNVIWQLPLFLAVAHNAVAAILVINMAVLRVKLRKTED